MKKLIIGAISAAMVLVGLAAVPVSAAVICPEGTSRVGEVVNSYALCNLEEEEGSPTKLWDTINGIINVILAALGIAAVFMIILGGVWFLTSQGDPGKIKKAKDTILYGIIGLVVALLAFAIVNFVLEGIFGGGSTTGGGGTGSETTVTDNNKNN